MNPIIKEARESYHRALLDSILTVDANGVASNADKSSRLSKEIAKGITDILLASTQEKSLGQTSGRQFEEINMEFLRNTFPKLSNLRPGSWEIIKLGNNNRVKTSDFSQYEHLAYLNALTKANTELAAVLGNDYMVSPDVII